MVTKVRKQIYIDPVQDALLKWLAKGTGATEAEIIRQAIERHASYIRFPKHNLVAWEEERAFIIHLIQQGPVPGKRTWQREELHER